MMMMMMMMMMRLLEVEGNGSGQWAAGGGRGGEVGVLFIFNISSQMNMPSGVRTSGYTVCPCGGVMRVTGQEISPVFTFSDSPDL